MYIPVQGAAEKIGPLKFFTVFSANVWNFWNVTDLFTKTCYI